MPAIGVVLNGGFGNNIVALLDCFSGSMVESWRRAELWFSSFGVAQDPSPTPGVYSSSGGNHHGAPGAILRLMSFAFRHLPSLSKPPLRL